MGKGLGMGLSDAELRVIVLASFSLALPLHSVRSFLWAFSEVPSKGRPRQWLSSAWAVDPKINWTWARATISLAPQVSKKKKKKQQTHINLNLFVFNGKDTLCS